jgi:thiol-disulfide isomerase/thioredoxin
MGMDAVFVHLGKYYFIKDRPEWFSDQQLKKLAERVYSLDPLLIGKKAPNIVAKDTAMEKVYQLHDVEADYTVLYIWSPECGHCREATPKLKKMYHKFKEQGVDIEVFAVGNEFENEDWIEYIRKNKLDWINVSDGGDFRSNFRSLYDVYSTPQTYLLDKNKKILSKKMNVESLEKILEYYIEKDKTEAQ